MKMYDWIQKSGRLEKIDECAAEYIDFLTAGKTERLCVKEIVKKAENRTEIFTTYQKTFKIISKRKSKFLI